jgi:hypothetical protein
LVQCPVCGKPKADKEHLRTEHPEYFPATKTWRNTQSVSTILCAVFAMLFITFFYPNSGGKSLSLFTADVMFGLTGVGMAISLYAFYRQISLGKEYRATENSTTQKTNS